VNTDFLKLATKKLGQRKLFEPNVEKPLLYCVDARDLLEKVPLKSVDFVLTSPPYWNILNRKRTADYKAERPYSILKEDIGNIDDYKVFLNELQGIYEKVHDVLKPGKRCVVIVMDIRQGSKFIEYHSDISRLMQRIGFVLEDIIIWNRGREYNNLRPLGYPYVFVVNKVHEYILIFRRNNISDVEEKDYESFA
jgi:DNA modification methylase